MWIKIIKFLEDAAQIALRATFIFGIAWIGYRRDKSLSRYRTSDLQSRSMQAAICTEDRRSQGRIAK